MSRPGHCPASDPGAPRPARNLVRRRSAPVAPVAARPALTSSRGPTARLRSSGPSSRRRLSQCHNRGRRPLSVSPHGRSRRRGSGITSSPGPAPLCPAPLRPAPRAPRPRLCARAGSPAASAHAGVRAWEGKPTPPSGFCACPRTGRRRKTTAERAQARLLVDNASTGGLRGPGTQWDPAGPRQHLCASTAAFIHSSDISFNSCSFFYSFAGTVTFNSPRHPLGPLVSLRFFHKRHLFKEGATFERCQSPICSLSSPFSLLTPIEHTVCILLIFFVVYCPQIKAL